MQPGDADEQKFVRSEFSGKLISIKSEAWRHECEVAFLLGLPAAMQDEFLDGSSAPNHRNLRGIRTTRGAGVVAMLRAEIARLASIRRGTVTRR